MKALLHTLSDADRDLVRETEPKRMAELDEDGLVDLHKRVRRARNKYVKVYRRKASDRVAEKGARGKAGPKNQRNAARAEVFEDTLARVSAALAAAAERSAADLKAERLAASRARRSSGPSSNGQSSDRSRGSRGRARAATTKSPVRKKREASSKAAGARRQAKRDSR